MKKHIRKIFHFLGYEIRKYNILNSSELMRSIYFQQKNIDLVIDVGANVGQYAISLLEEGYKGKIVSFEPLTEAHSILRAKSIRFPNWEIAKKCGLGDKNEDMIINISRNLASSSFLAITDTHISIEPQTETIGQEKVTIIRLEDYQMNWSDYNSIFLKIDAQGFEDRVLDGLKALLPKIQGIEIELSLVTLYKNQFPYRKMVDHLEHMGFVPFGIYPGFSDLKNARMYQLEGFFTKLENESKSKS